jgi:multidrug efflux system outer membrane protein
MPPNLAAVPLPLSLDEAIRRAVDQSLSLRKSSIDLASAEYAAKNLWAEIFPGISAQTELNYGSSLFTGDGFWLGKSGMDYRLSLGLSLSLNAGIPSAIKKIELAYRTRLLDYEDARRQLEIQTAKSFYGLIADRENLAYFKETLELTERQLEKNRIAFENGLVGELAYLQSRLAVQTARYDLSDAQTGYAYQMGEFLLLLGLDQDVEAVPVGGIEITRIELDPERLIREYLAKRPDIVSRRQLIEHLEYTEKQTALSLRAPSLNLSAQWRGSGIDQFADTLSGGVRLDIPIDSWIPGTKDSQEIRSAGADLEKARLDLKDAENAAASQIRSLAAQLRNSWDSIEIARLRVQLAERTYELTETGFMNGTVESLALENTRKDMAEARQQLLRGELAYQSMTLDLAAALNLDWKEFSRSMP